VERALAMAPEAVGPDARLALARAYQAMGEPVRAAKILADLPDRARDLERRRLAHR